jgi:hypothetical protein
MKNITISVHRAPRLYPAYSAALPPRPHLQGMGAPAACAAMATSARQWALAAIFQLASVVARQRVGCDLPLWLLWPAFGMDFVLRPASFLADRTHGEFVPLMDSWVCFTMKFICES